MFVSHAALAFAKIAWKTTKTHAWNAGHSLIVWIKKCRFSWQKRAFHVKHCRFWRGFLLSFYIGIRRIHVYFSPCFSIKTRIKVFCIADLIILFFSMLRQGTWTIMFVSIIFNRLLSGIICRHGFFLLFFFGITKNRRFGRLVYCLRDSVLQNNDFSHKKGVLLDAV